MILYKVDEINNAISEMKNSVDEVITKSSAHLIADVDKYKNEKLLIANDTAYSDSGKEEKINELSLTHLAAIKVQGDGFIKEIEAKYDAAISKVSDLTRFDAEEKTINQNKADKVKENTDLMYAIQILNFIDDRKDIGVLKELLQQYKTNEKIINLVKHKADKLSREKIESEDLQELTSTIRTLDTDYVEQLKAEKNNRINFYRQNNYPSGSVSPNLDKIYGFHEMQQAKFFK